MKKFHFPLQRLLKVREHQVKAGMHSLMQKENQWRLTKAQVEQEQKDILLEEREMQHKRRVGDLSSELHRGRYVEFLKSQHAASKEELRKAHERRLREQKEVASQVQKRKMIEKIRQAKYSQWHVACAREENSI